MIQHSVETKKRQIILVISAGQSRNPEKRQLEQAIAEEAASLEGIRVLKIPHLYDLPKDSQTYQAMRPLTEDLVVVSWLYDRATHWILDRNGVRGQFGDVWLKQDTGEDEEDEIADQAEEANEERVIDSQPRPKRQVFCIDFRASDKAADFVEELLRIQETLSYEVSQTNGGAGFDNASAEVSSDLPSVNSESQHLTLEMLERYNNPTNDTFVGSAASGDAGTQSASGEGTSGTEALAVLFGDSGVASIEEHHGRRWYPVIDFSRCTNCMECIDFCLFGVYGVDSVETIVVEQADNCRKGCPACSRVCPQNAIIFPQHKTPAIAGAPVDAGGLKIDLSKLFGAPETDEDPAVVAARERDEQLILAGRQAVGVESSGIDQRLAESQAKQTKTDELDNLLDELDSLDL